MTKHELADIVSGLIAIGKEGAYWDFKQEWHSDMAALLKDIICFTNTVHDRDCYIVFGVNDALEIVEMKAQRRKQADIIDALDKLSFASVHTPQIAVETIIIENTELDVLIIYNTDQTPVYLKKPYGKMLAGCIYTRNEDRNTPDSGNAEIEQIEYLWKKRFGLTKPALQFILEHLANKHEWSELDGRYYNIYRPEYLLHVHDDEDTDRRSDEFYGYVQTNESMSFEMLDIIANNTVLLSHQLAVLDSGRLVVPIPEWGYIACNQYHQNSVAYKYYVENSDTHRLLGFLYDPANMEQRHALSRHMKVVLLYHTPQERGAFEAYAATRINDLDQYIADHKDETHICTDEDTKTELYTARILTGIFLNKLIEEFRKQ